MSILNNSKKWSLRRSLRSCLGRLLRNLYWHVSLTSIQLAEFEWKINNVIKPFNVLKVSRHYFIKLIFTFSMVFKLNCSSVDAQNQETEQKQIWCVFPPGWHTLTWNQKTSCSLRQTGRSLTTHARERTWGGWRAPRSDLSTLARRPSTGSTTARSSPPGITGNPATF